ncbi:MAG TPA: hypothetical protein VFG05_01915 [Methylocella sp.]|nr:hypothetical protein [Methylocella sp.]
MSNFTQRAESLADLRDIWGLLRQVADDIPFDLRSEVSQECLLSEAMACCTSGLSGAALDGEKAVIGTLLARRDDFEWGLRNSDAIHVSYAAIAPGRREQGVLASLIAGIQERKVPVFVSVKRGNQIGLAEELGKLGFKHECTAESGWGDLYKWLPPRAN